MNKFGKQTKSFGIRRVFGLRRVFVIGLLEAVVATSGCTTLGAMPLMSMANSTPQDRMDAELQFAMTPGFYLSDSVKEQNDNVGSVHPQVAGWLDPGELLGPAKGLGGLRGVVRGDGYIEPMLRCRTGLDDDGVVSLGSWALSATRTEKRKVPATTCGAAEPNSPLM